MKGKGYFDSIIGEQLSSVEFAMDYLQLHFDGNDITFYCWPIIDIDGITYLNNDVNYKNILCSLIGKEVLSVLFIENTEITISFISNGKIVFSLLRNEFNKNLKELLYYKDFNNDWFVID